MSTDWTAIDPFDLPEWLGTDEVSWASASGLGGDHLVPGELRSASGTLGCDLLAVDEAYPAPVLDDATRTVAHREWHHGQVLVLGRADRITLAVPGRRLDPARTLDALGRLALAVGADPDRYAVVLRIGRDAVRATR